MPVIVRRTGLSNRLGQYEIPIEPVEYDPKPQKKRIAIFDTETDPFLPGRVVAPFTCGFLLPDTGEYWDFWGDDCIDQFFAFLAKEFDGQELVILVHNGGNFDFYFLTEYFDHGHKPFIINGRLVRIMAGGQEFRDSYAMMPVALGTYDKGKIDYRCLERGFRDVFRDDILVYQKRDCTSLGELVVQWYDMFGDRLTMASVALPMLRSYHGFETLSEKLDEDMRPFYFGGRNQCFATGVIEGDFKVYDINSSYPDVMSRYEHPISDVPKFQKTITDKTHFAFIRAWSLGALPVRKDDGGLEFPIGTRDFYACIHEIRAGLETKTLKILKVYHSVYFERSTNFAEFIDTYYKLRLAASAEGDEVRKLFYKLVMNSSYGKFAQDPRKYENWLFDPEEIPTPFYCDNCHKALTKRTTRDDCLSCSNGTTSPYGWYLHTTRDGRNIYASPQRTRAGSFFNVATAASITSAARASLLRGIQAATRPLYCDTDSVICTGMESTASNSIVLDPKRLGAWDCEATGDTVAIAGKKMYAIFNKGVEVKKASKGVKLTAAQILRVCQGEVIEYANPVPKFKLDGSADFVTRRIRKTG
jgi:hypothetical protein